MSGPRSDPMTRADFERCFVDEPGLADPLADLERGRTRRRRGLVVRGALAGVAVVAVAGVTGSVLSTGRPAVGPVGVPTAVPSSPSARASTPPSDAPTSAASATPSGDTAPALVWDKRKGYLDRDGRSLNGSGVRGASAFAATTKNSWLLAREHLDPQHRHLGAYEAFAFTGGGTGSGGIEVGQKLGWTVRGDAGQGMIQLAVARLDPGARPHLGPGSADVDGFCNDLYVDPGTCRKTTVDGLRVYLGRTPDGGFVMDRLQADGEIASIVVSPLFGNNTTVALKAMGITTSQAAALLDDPALDVVG